MMFFFVIRPLFFSPPTKETKLLKAQKKGYIPLHISQGKVKTLKQREGVPKWKWEVGDITVTTLLSRAPTLMIIIVPYKTPKTFSFGRASFFSSFYSGTI